MINNKRSTYEKSYYNPQNQSKHLLWTTNHCVKNQMDRLTRNNVIALCIQTGDDRPITKYDRNFVTIVWKLIKSFNKEWYRVSPNMIFGTSWL